MVKQELETILQRLKEEYGRGNLILAVDSVVYGKVEDFRELCKEGNRGKAWVCFLGEAALDPRKNPKAYLDNVQCGECLFYHLIDRDYGDCLNPDSKHFGHIEFERASCRSYTPDPDGWDRKDRPIKIPLFLNGEIELEEFKVVRKSNLQRVTGVGYYE